MLFCVTKTRKNDFSDFLPDLITIGNIEAVGLQLQRIVKDASVCSLGHHMPAPQGGWLALVEQVRLLKMVVVKRARGQLTAHKIRGHIYKMRNNSGNYPCKTHPYKLVVGITRSPHFVVPSIGLFIAHVDARYTAPCLPQLMVGPRF